MSRRGDAVVVSINHRLNVLGYFDLSAFGSEYANSGNAGMDDIIASLKWVQENIEKFGGDPKNVTVFGQSGGGAKVTTLLPVLFPGFPPKPNHLLQVTLSRYTEPLMELFPEM